MTNQNELTIPATGFDVDLDLRALSYVGSHPEKRDHWVLAGPYGVPLVLELHDFDDDSGAIVNLHIPTFRFVNPRQAVALACDVESSGVQMWLPNGWKRDDDPEVTARKLIDLLAHAMRSEDPVFERGSLDELRFLFQALANFSNTSFIVHAAKDETHPASILGVDRRNPVGATAYAILNWFNPIGTNPADVRRGRIDVRQPALLFNIKADKDMPAHDRMEFGLPLRTFLESHAQELGFTDRALKSRLKVLGLA